MKTAPVRTPLPLSLRDVAPANDNMLEDDFDDLVTHAAGGDPRAVGAIAIALGPMLLEVAHEVLGEYGDEDAEVLQDFLRFLVDGDYRYLPAHGRALPWMCRIVRAIAQTRRKQREWQALRGE